MSKGLEALELLKTTYGNATYIYIDKYQDLPQPSTRTLKETIIPIIEKELKALEIIKNKKVDVGYLDSCLNEEFDSVDKYNEIVYEDEDEYKLTQEEYDLLKEVLL